MIKKVLFALALIIAFGILGNSDYGHSNAAQPPLARTGAPSETTCAGSGCHAGSPQSNSPNLLINFDNNSSGYAPGETYTIVLSNNQSGVRYGFEMTALNAQNQSVGTFIANQSQQTSTSTATTGLQRSYIHHLGAVQHTGNSYTFQWTAPATNVGNITFYAAGNAANGNANGNGDVILTKSLTISPATSVGDAPEKIESIQANPNPATDYVNLSYTVAQTQKLYIHLYDLSGKKVLSLDKGTQAAGSYTETLSLNRDQLLSGLYFVYVQGETHSQAIKLILE